MFSIQESVQPSAYLRNHYSEISKQCRENNEAVIITVNGRGDTVLLSYEEYKRMKSRIENAFRAGSGSIPQTVPAMG